MAGLFRLERAARPEHTALLLEELAACGWKRTTGDDWMLDWSFGLHYPAVYNHARSDQRLNHFPGIVTQHSKDELAHFLARAAQLGGRQTSRSRLRRSRCRISSMRGKKLPAMPKRSGSANRSVEPKASAFD